MDEDEPDEMPQRPLFVPGELKLHLKSVILNGVNVDTVSVKFFIENVAGENTDWQSSTQRVYNKKAEWEAESMAIHLTDPSAEIVVEIREGTSDHYFGICESQLGFFAHIRGRDTWIQLEGHNDTKKAGRIHLKSEFRP